MIDKLTSGIENIKDKMGLNPDEINYDTNQRGKSSQVKESLG